MKFIDFFLDSAYNRSSKTYPIISWYIYHHNIHPEDTFITFKSFNHYNRIDHKIAHPLTNRAAHHLTSTPTQQKPHQIENQLRNHPQHRRAD